jgi:hypothetical protein
LFGAGGRSGSTRSAVDSVQRGVEVGYRVIDEYMKQGASMAGSFTGPAAASAPGAADLSGMTERMVKYASDFTSLWFEAMGQVMTASSASSAANGKAPNGAASNAAKAPASRQAKAPPDAGTVEPQSFRVALHVRSRATVNVDLTLDDAAEVGTVWKVESLRRRGADHAITNASIAPPPTKGGPLRVAIDVPEKTPPGRYTAAVVDEASGQPRGRLTIVVSS